jgi:hypothetical protein
LGVAKELEAWHLKVGDDGCVTNWFSFATMYYQSGHGYRMPSVLSASAFVDATASGSKDIVAEAVTYATWRMGLPCFNAADNYNMDACLQVPANISPYLVTVGATTIRVTPKKMATYSFSATQDLWWDAMPKITALPSVIIQDSTTWWTNHGGCVDIYGPGDHHWAPASNTILTTWVGTGDRR